MRYRGHKILCILNVCASPRNFACDFSKQVNISPNLVPISFIVLKKQAEYKLVLCYTTYVLEYGDWHFRPFCVFGG